MEPWTSRNTPRRIEVIIKVLFGGDGARLAKKIGVHPGTVSRWRRGRVPAEDTQAVLEKLEGAAMRAYLRK